MPIIIQLVFFIAIYRVLLNISGSDFVVNQELLYSFVSNPGRVDTLFLGIVDLTEPNVILAVITAGAQYIQMKMMMNRKEQEKTKQEKKKQEKKKEVTEEEKKPDPGDFAQMMNTQMLYVFPALTLVIGITFGAGLILYWLTSTLFMIAQQWYIMKSEKTK